MYLFKIILSGNPVKLGVAEFLRVNTHTDRNSNSLRLIFVIIAYHGLHFLVSSTTFSTKPVLDRSWGE